MDQRASLLHRAIQPAHDPPKTCQAGSDLATQTEHELGLFTAGVVRPFWPISRRWSQWVSPQLRRR